MDTQTLKVLLADTVALKFKAHGYHWNVEGPDFAEWHQLFRDIYEDMEGAIDTFAEWIRMLSVDDYAPFHLDRLSELSEVPELAVKSDPKTLASDLCESLDAVTERLKRATQQATDRGEYGLANFLGDRQAAHQKWCWQLRAALKGSGGSLPR
jgi:starvation-inducible DNA-binding protein